MKRPVLWRQRLVMRDAVKAAAGLENLRVGVNKLADRAVGAGNWQMYAVLREAARLMGQALGELDMVKAIWEARHGEQG